MSSLAAAGFAPARLDNHTDVPRALSLTFDDGPDATWTPLVLEALVRTLVMSTSGATTGEEAAVCSHADAGNLRIARRKGVGRSN